MAVQLHRDDGPWPMIEFEMLFRLDGRKLRYTGQRWRDGEAHHSPFPSRPDPSRPGTRLALRLLDLVTLEAAYPSSLAVAVAGGTPRPPGARPVVRPGADAAPRPLVRYDVTFELAGRVFRLVARRWRERDARERGIACIPDPTEPGTSVAPRLISLATGATCDPLPPEDLSGEWDLRGLVGLLRPHACPP